MTIANYEFIATDQEVVRHRELLRRQTITGDLVSPFDTPGSIDDLIDEWTSRVEARRIDPQEISVETAVSTARILGRVAVCLGAAGVAVGAFAGSAIEGHSMWARPETGIGAVALFGVLVATVGLWCREHLPR